VPTFFHLTHPPDRYIAAAAWPLVLLGGLGLILIAVALIASSSKVDRRKHYLIGWIGVAIALLILAWLDSNPTSNFLPMIDWRIRSVVIFTCVFVGSTIIVVLALRVLLRLTQSVFAKNMVGG